MSKYFSMILICLIIFIQNFQATISEEQAQHYFLQNMFCIMGVRKYIYLHKKILKKTETFQFKTYFYKKLIAGLYGACLKDVQDPELFTNLLFLKGKNEIKDMVFPFFVSFNLEEAVFMKDYNLSPIEKTHYKMYLKMKKKVENFLKLDSETENWKNLTETKKAKEIIKNETLLKEAKELFEKSAKELLEKSAKIEEFQNVPIVFPMKTEDEIQFKDEDFGINTEVDSNVKNIGIFGAVFTCLIFFVTFCKQKIEPKKVN